MKVYLKRDISVSKTTEHWSFSITPMLLLERSDIFSDMQSFYLHFHWLVFHVYLIFTFKNIEK